MSLYFPLKVDFLQIPSTELGTQSPFVENKWMLICINDWQYLVQNRFQWIFLKWISKWIYEQISTWNSFLGRDSLSIRPRSSRSTNVLASLSSLCFFTRYWTHPVNEGTSFSFFRAREISEAESQVGKQ